MDYQTIIVGIAGGTGSGKTSVTKAIIEDLKKSEKDCVLCSFLKYNIENINFDNGNIIIKLKSLQNNLYLETIIIYYKEKKIGEISINENLYVESISNSKYIDINSYIFEYPINNDLLWILGEKNEKYNISSGPYMENEFIFETVIKDKANNKIYNLKREIDILFVEQGKTRRWTFDH